jgi:hypothetical protein
MEHVDSSSSARADYHAVRFYACDASLARIVAEFLHEGFGDGTPGIVVATASQQQSIIQELTDRSLDVAGLQRSDDLLFLDAEETLATFMNGSTPDARKFSVQMCDVIEKVCSARTKCKVRIFGQMVDVLWQRGEQEAAVRLEVLWNRLAHTETFSLLCGYAIGNFYKNASFENVCRQHTHIVSDDGQAQPLASNNAALPS